MQKISEVESTYYNQMKSDDTAATSHTHCVTSSQNVTVYIPKISRILPPLPVRLQKWKDVVCWHSLTFKMR